MIQNLVNYIYISSVNQRAHATFGFHKFLTLALPVEIIMTG